MTPALTALALLIQTAQAPAPPGFDELVVLRGADEICALFDRPHRSLLDASLARARDDQVRAGYDPAALDRAEARIEGALAVDCADPVLAALAVDHRARVDALAGYSDLTFPGVHRAWSVDRGAVRAGTAGQARWRVSQRDGAGVAFFGVFQQDGAMHLALAYSGDSSAARAGLVFRDPRRQAYPLDFTAGGLLPAPDNDPAASWGAGARGQTRISADARLDPDAAARLAPADGETARGFEFPDAVLQSLASLTPRESLGVELFDATGQVTGRFWFEVGALRAALAMQAIALSVPEPAATDAAALP